MKAKKIHYMHGIFCCTLMSGCATAPPTQEMSDARQSVEAAETIGAGQHAPEAFDNAQRLLSKAQDDMQAGKFAAAQKDAIAAREAARQAVIISQAKQAETATQSEEIVEKVTEDPPETTATTVVAEPQSEPVSTTTYVVKQNDNLWDIAARASVYSEPLLWPLIFKANAGSINDADLIFPDQILVIETAPSEGDKTAARQFARQRGRNATPDEDASYLRQYSLR
ncbi:MAG: LysM peptidoglycan-binding domain-containing protein [Planctomycetaceae bacterium]|nr:LysM peptidoglycan-binding domain-containing protein [Planctomycetaceae bacterium]